MKNKIIFITGAGQGLGRALAIACAQQGATVLLHGRKSEKLDRVYDEIVDAGGAEPYLMPLDFAQAGVDAFTHIADAIKNECGKLDALVHCAAELGAVAPIGSQTIEQLRATWIVNTLAPIMLTRACEGVLHAATSPAVIFSTDSHVATPGPFWGGYGVAKAGIDHFARMLAREWAFARVHAVAPGAIDSPLRNKTHPGEAKSERLTLDAMAEQYVALIKSAPLGWEAPQK
jgi:NAD(P)-dependent dehydrogenase (short-subunit alcohol dehydrogenase family)